MTLRLESSFTPGPGGGTLDLALVNAGTLPLRGFALGWCAIARVKPGAAIEGGTLEESEGTHQLVRAPGDGVLEPGGTWRVRVPNVRVAAINPSFGPRGAYVMHANGALEDVSTGDMAIVRADGAAVTQVGHEEAHGAVPRLPARSSTELLAVLPRPAHVAIHAWRAGPPALLAPASTAVLAVSELCKRLFPMLPHPFRLDGPGVPLRCERRDGPVGYRIEFAPDAVTLDHADDRGLVHGLITLAQTVTGTLRDPAARFPLAGHIEDAPRHAWRGAMLDVARRFRSAETLARFVDVMAWHKMNVLHLHLTDDEGWRLPVPAYPELMDAGAWRGRGLPIPPQFDGGPHRVGGAYTAREIRALVARAAALGIDVMPEIDMPGHASAALRALPWLADPDEPADSYRADQNWPCNALNPGCEAVERFVGDVLDAVCELFPFGTVHLGGDEVAARAWHASPRARDLARHEGLDGTAALQGHFMRRVQAMLRERGRRMGAWDEVVAGGVERDALIFAWRSPERGAEALRAGHDVVMTPQEAYYLDIAQSDHPADVGVAWAGIVPPRATYAFEATDALPEGAGERLLGVQAALWGELREATSLLQPRLAAVAEAGWTPRGERDWNRFASLVPLMPDLATLPI